MPYFRYLFLWLCFNCFLVSCDTTRVKPQLAFYYWKTSFDLSPSTQQYLSQLGITQLYLRFFDVHWNSYLQEAEPLAALQLQNATAPTTYAIVPVVFITNVTLKNTPNKALDKLAQKIGQKIQKIYSKLSNKALQEIQIDCDWSVETKEKYFTLLQHLKKQLPQGAYLSATIRLHQLKYPDIAGIPPVGRGLLMYYNMGDLESKNTANSILDNSIAQKYLTNYHAYKLPLDFALPLYSWGVVKRGGRVVHLLSEVEEQTLRADIDLQALNTLPNHKLFVVQKTHYLGGVVLYPQDTIRLESPQIADLVRASELLKKQVNSSHFRLVFYHLTKPVEQKYSPKQLQDLHKLWY